MADRAQQGLAARGIRIPGTADPGPQKLLPATASPGAIGEIPSQRAATIATATDAVTTDDREPVAAGTVAAEGLEAERGDWHRDLPG